MTDSIRFHHMVLDVIKWSVVLFVIHILWFFVSPTRNTLLAPQFIGMFLFLISGLLTYWLVVDPYRNSIYPLQPMGNDVEVPDCEAPPKEGTPYGVPDTFLKE